MISENYDKLFVKQQINRSQLFIDIDFAYISQSQLWIKVSRQNVDTARMSGVIEKAND